MSLTDEQRRWLEVERVSAQLHKIVNGLTMVGSSEEEKKDRAEKLTAYLKYEKEDEDFASKDWTAIDQRITAGDAYWQS